MYRDRLKRSWDKQPEIDGSQASRDSSVCGGGRDA